MATRSNKRQREETITKPQAKRRKTDTKQLSFTDDEGDTIVFRLSERKGQLCLSEHVNGKQTLARATKMSIDERTGKVVDDDGEADCFRLNEKDRLVELKELAEEAGIAVEWVADTPEQPAVEPDAAADEELVNTGVVVSPGKSPKDLWEEPTKQTTEPQPEPTPKQIDEVVKPHATPKRGRSPRRSKSRSKSRTRTPRKPKVWEPITFEDTDGLKVTFDMTESGHLRETVDGKVTIERVSRLSINTAIFRITDDDGEADGFTLSEDSVEKLGKLRDMAARAMDLDLYWSTEKPAPAAWCSVQ